MSPRGGGGVRLIAVGRTDLGRRRPDNQDRMLVHVSGGAALGQGDADAHAFGPEDISSDRPVVALVADGMGGRAGGARASALTVDAVRRHFTGPDAPVDDQALVRSLVSALRSANRAVFDEAASDQAVAGMGTTATLAAVCCDHVYVAQVGDSRAYLIRGGEIVRLTRDQSLVQDLIDSGILDEEDADSVNDNMLLQAIGVQETVRPAATWHALREGDRILLCSDGLSQMVPDEQILEMADGLDDPSELADRLVELANDRGGPDNTTVVLLDLRDSGLPAPSEGDVLEPRRWRKKRP